MSRFQQFRQWLASTSRRTDQGRGQRQPITPLLLALVIIMLVALGLLAGCTTTQPIKPTGNKFNLPPDHCLRERAKIDVTNGTARTVYVCELWYFGPSREQDERFKSNQKRLGKD